MTLPELKHAISVIEKLRETEKKLQVAFSELNENSNYGMLGNVEYDYIRLLEIAADDKDKWISYFIYDCDLGKEPHAVKQKDGKELQLKTVEQLWKLINEK